MGSMKEKRKNHLAPPFAAETRDARFAGTFEVLVPVPGRNKPHKIPLQFPTLAAAENWMHSPEGREQIDAALQTGGGK
jgi:antibiotic biosynthesis monooxygenase (ABM) superfamily enzyme